MNQTEIIRVEGLPPGVNHIYENALRWGKNKQGELHSYMGRKLSAEAVAWKELVALQCASQRRRPFQDWSGIPLEVDIDIFAHDRRMDIDGGVKITLDAVAGALDFNDKMVDFLVVVRAVREGPESITILVAGQGVTEKIIAEGVGHDAP